MKSETELISKQASKQASKQGIVVIGNIMDESNKNYAGYRVYDPSGISPCVTASGRMRDIFIIEKRKIE